MGYSGIFVDIWGISYLTLYHISWDIVGNKGVYCGISGDIGGFHPRIYPRFHYIIGGTRPRYFTIFPISNDIVGYWGNTLSNIIPYIVGYCALSGDPPPNNQLISIFQSIIYCWISPLQKGGNIPQYSIHSFTFYRGTRPPITQYPTIFLISNDIPRGTRPPNNPIS